MILVCVNEMQQYPELLGETKNCVANIFILYENSLVINPQVSIRK